MPKSNYKKVARAMKRMDPASAVTDAEYKAAMKKLNANKKKNAKEARKSNY